jgi:hypothetical protein
MLVEDYLRPAAARAGILSPLSDFVPARFPHRWVCPRPGENSARSPVQLRLCARSAQQGGPNRKMDEGERGILAGALAENCGARLSEGSARRPADRRLYRVHDSRTQSTVPAAYSSPSHLIAPGGKIPPAPQCSFGSCARLRSMAGPVLATLTSMVILVGCADQQEIEETGGGLTSSANPRRKPSSAID